MQVDWFDYDLPDSLIAQTPLKDRTASRLLTLNKTTGAVDHKAFPALIDYMEAGDVLVLNDTRVLPARLFGVKSGTGSKAELLLLKQLEGDRWEALVRPGKRLKTGAVILFGEAEADGKPLLTATIEEESDMGGRVVRFSYEGIFPELLDRLGQMPLPPYIKEQLPEKERYQTVYARNEGSAAAPTAGLHFTEAYLNRLEQKGIQLAYITLHVGLGTFRPVSVDDVETHEMHEEFYEVSEEAAARINAAKAGGHKVIAVGTTSARTLETAARNCQQSGRVEAGSGWTGIFIYPGYTFQIVDALLTNFHLPKSTLLMLISALAGREQVLAAYREAVDQEYRFFSFGDAMFIY
ncbi:tRNA preQ1(34) S-adenosylmethionine ribosyltransferase-isomerase QueA [Paenibacillus sp. WQ 127069]|jgi:S-adenosylmethionine:tRNA ribosyltransferase-isomerase|uniref:S-adenosylmethionine:tRNA ribosyltransferase-isomerase n=1 Tax=Paenibacillus baimaensis TaxID=2982185 RepID=A0ABT2UA71_9BACL|nr:tRNA preQ1(34) S-adenosylmethionine ribosyltransferase-isomerase QueA [Paenibacillus sp. WQ 127069]MCU6791538.1 tRNA preQ1(34) S-adenosylmethionine ribosyltransferase-isomerase QueA [Paenibacillus sp. WQ 127069]